MSGSSGDWWYRLLLSARGNVVIGGYYLEDGGYLPR